MENPFVAGLTETTIPELKKTITAIVMDLVNNVITAQEADKKFEELTCQSTWRNAHYSFAICDEDPDMTRGAYGTDEKYNAFLYYISPETDMNEEDFYLTKYSVPLDSNTQQAEVEDYFDTAIDSTWQTEVLDFKRIFVNSIHTLCIDGVQAEDVTREKLLDLAHEICEQYYLPELNDDAYIQILKDIEQCREYARDEDINVAAEMCKRINL